MGAFCCKTGCISCESWHLALVICLVFHFVRVVKLLPPRFAQHEKLNTVWLCMSCVQLIGICNLYKSFYWQSRGNAIGACCSRGLVCRVCAMPWALPSIVVQHMCLLQVTLGAEKDCPSTVGYNLDNIHAYEKPSAVWLRRFRMIATSSAGG